MLPYDAKQVEGFCRCDVSCFTFARKWSMTTPETLNPDYKAALCTDHEGKYHALVDHHNDL